MISWELKGGGPFRGGPQFSGLFPKGKERTKMVISQ